MHILFATIDFIDNNGPTTGLPKYLFRVSKSLISMGHKVSIVAAANRTVDYEFFGIHVYKVRRVSIKKHEIYEDTERANALRDGRIIHDAIERISQYETIDIIQYTSLEGIALFHDFDIPSVMRLSSYAVMVPYKGREKRQEMYGELERLSSEKCDALFAPSTIVAERFSKDVGRDVPVIETPFVMEVNDIDMSVYEELFAGKKYVLFYGTLVEHKGLDIIAATVRDILEADSNLHIGIIGDGELSYVDKINNSAGDYSDRVIYHGAVGFEKLRPVIENAEAILIPSLIENFSNACVESMALGKIVIGASQAGFEQLIDDEKSGFIFSLDNNDSFAEAVKKAIRLSEKDKETMENNAGLRTEALQPDIVVKQLIQYYEDTIDKRN